MFRAVSILFLCVCCLSPKVYSQPAAQQAISLELGWNLVSIQVGSSLTPAAFQATLQHPDRLVEVWGYESSGNPSVPGVWKVHRFQNAAPGFPNELTSIQPCKGYWMKVATGRTVATLSGTPWDGAVSIRKGWNLVGFPGLAINTDEIQELSAVFGLSFDRIQQMWGFDASSSRFLGYDTSAIPQLKELTAISPGMGYWVYSISDSDLNLSPSPFVALPADSDSSPPQAAQLYTGTNPKYLGKQVRLRAADGSDTPYDLNNNGILDDVETQDTILFEVASEAIPITIGNKGSGILTWSLENATPWIYTAPADPRTWPAGVTTRPKLASGTVSSEKDTLTLYADRTGMSPGRKPGDAVTLWVGGQARVIQLLIDVPEIDGDWIGSATTTRVGGKEVSLGEVRLALNAFRPTNGGGGAFRAVLNREKAILFPRDVYMDGIFFSGSQFKLTTNFEMPPGDRNAPPYNTFQHTTPADFPGDPSAVKKAARGDKDWNGDGKVDVMNPFPFGIRREITLIGTRTTPNRLEGTYIEAIRGMLPPITSNALPTDLNQFLGNSFLSTSQPVFIEGTFVLQRQTFTPSQRSIVNTTVEPGVTVGGSSSGSRTETINVTSSGNVNGTITINVNLDLGQVDPALIRVAVVSPSGNTYTLHDYEESFAGQYVLPSGTFAGEGVGGNWQLVIEWDNTSGERATLESWGLKIEAASTHSASGRIVQQGGTTPIPNASITLEGGITTFTTVSAADGTFEFPELTENDYSLVINAPGYQPTTYTFFIGEQDLTLDDIALSLPNPPITTPTIKGPLVPLGYEPFHVDFQVLLPLGYGATQISWNFGDGSAPISGPLSGEVTLPDQSKMPLIAPSHRYLAAGSFTPTATLSGGSLSSPLTVSFNQAVHVQRRTPDLAVNAAPTQMHSVIQMGSVAARMDAGANTIASAPFSLANPQTVFTEGATTVNMNSATVYQESQWDSATFDLDRFPFGTSNWTFSRDMEDSDYGKSGAINSGGQVFIFYNTSATDNGTTLTDEKWDARGWGTTPQVPPPPSSLPALPTGDLYQSDGIYAPFTPANTNRPERLRMSVTLGGAVLGTLPSPMGDVLLLPGRTLR